VETQSGDWWAVFLATRPYGKLADGRDLYNTGRETFLMPVRWEGGWPVIAAGNETVPYAHRRPALPAQPAAPFPLSGNFAVRDEFDADGLAPSWLMIRTPREPWHRLEAGGLVLRARRAPMGATLQPSFVGRRQQHTNASASTELRYEPATAGEEAGLVAFQNDEHYYFLGLTRDGDGRTIVCVKKRAGAGPAAVIASTPIESRGRVFLRIDARGGRYDFQYSLREGEWTPLLRDADGAILSTRIAGGFVGTVIGMYASSEASR
jgi:alpha-N-arabinofuranosidase